MRSFPGGECTRSEALSTRTGGHDRNACDALLLARGQGLHVFRIGDAAGRRTAQILQTKETVAGRGHQGGAGADLPAQREVQRLLLRRRGGRAGVGAGIGTALAARRTDGPGRWRAGKREGSDHRQGLGDAARLKGRRPQPTLERGRALGGAPAGKRRGAAGQDHDARVRLERRHRFAAHGHHPQSLESGDDSRRQQRRRGRGGGHRHGRAAYRHRRRRLDPHSRRVHRHLRHQAELRPRAGPSAEPVRHPGPCGTDDPHRRRRRADADRAVAARRPRLVCAATQTARTISTSSTPA